MSNRIFLDSSIQIESTKGTQTELYDHLTARNDLEKCINQIVLSEYTFYLLIIEGGKAPLTLKRDRSIPAIVKEHNPVSFLNNMTLLESGTAIIPLYLYFMQQYNLLPNDALILATCKLNGVDQMASYDADFVTACRNEGIRLIRSIGDLN